MGVWGEEGVSPEEDRYLYDGRLLGVAGRMVMGMGRRGFGEKNALSVWCWGEGLFTSSVCMRVWSFGESGLVGAIISLEFLCGLSGF